MSTPTASTERDPQTSAVIAAAIEVHRHLGRGFLEYVYRTPLELELLDRGVPFKREVQYPIVYKNKRTGIVFRVDLVCFGAVIVELKAMKADRLRTRPGDQSRRRRELKKGKGKEIGERRKNKKRRRKRKKADSVSSAISVDRGLLRETFHEQAPAPSRDGERHSA